MTLTKKITLYFNGEISEATETDLRNELKNYENISDFELTIFGNKNRSFDKLSDAYDRAISELDKKEHLQKLIDEVKAVNGTFVPVFHNYTFSAVDRWKGYRTLFNLILDSAE